MSSASPFRRSAPDVPRVRGAQWIRTLLVDPARFAGFWSAVTIPFLLLGMVVAGMAAQQSSLFAGLVVANVVALRVGHGHNRE